MMLKLPSQKYRAYELSFKIKDRNWVNNTITQAPIWLSTDLRDGNQALIEPMNATRKLRIFNTLLKIGFKEIEVGFPAASQTDFDFVRLLIESNLIPENVTIQVLTQARDDLILRTFHALQGAKRAIVHVYNATAPVFRKVVFEQSKEGVKEMATHATATIKQQMLQNPDTQWQLQYSPEVFSTTETKFALEVVNAVIDVYKPTITNKLIVNLPATIESTTPNIYADQIEYFINNVNKRECLTISLHTHNDRGTGIAASELGLLAGADRIEGCLFGNGERTGNVCLVTMALNMYTQGIDPGLDFSEIDEIRRVVEECNQLPVHPRHPYVGDLVHTAFSGSHQDAIRKGFAVRKDEDTWEIPYLPIDPNDIGKSYEAVIRINSQSGKGGISFLLEQEYGIYLPRRAQVEFSSIVQKQTDRLGSELTGSQIYELLRSEYLEIDTPFKLMTYKLINENGFVNLEAEIIKNGESLYIQGAGHGPLDALINALPVSANILDYHENALRSGTDAQAATYIELKVDQYKSVYGIGIDENTSFASIKAVFSALNRSFKNQ